MNTVPEKGLKQGGRYITFIPVQFPEQVLAQYLEYICIMIVNISFGQTKVQQLSFIVTYQMQLESEESSHAAFSRTRQIFEHPVSPDPFIVTNCYLGGIHESNARAFTRTDQFEK